MTYRKQQMSFISTYIYNAHMHTYIQYMHTYIHVTMCKSNTCIHTYLHTYIQDNIASAMLGWRQSIVRSYVCMYIYMYVCIFYVCIPMNLFLHVSRWGMQILFQGRCAIHTYTTMKTSGSDGRRARNTLAPQMKGLCTNICMYICMYVSMFICMYINLVFLCT